MRVDQFLARLVCATALGLVLASPANAQDTTSVGDKSGTGDIIVTARRAEERLQDVPISITVFNQQKISNRNVVTATDLATYTPSLRLPNPLNRTLFDKMCFLHNGESAWTLRVSTRPQSFLLPMAGKSQKSDLLKQLACAPRQIPAEAR